MMLNKSGRMTLSSLTAVGLWNYELCGQISDGMWENSSPYDHWKFWCNMDVVHGEKSSIENFGTMTCRKAAYAFKKLHQLKYDDGTYILRDRMLNCGRLVSAGLDPADGEALRAAGFMPKTLEEFRRNKTSGKWDHGFMVNVMDLISDELAVKFYETSYTLKHLNADLELIQTTMRQVVT